MDEKEAYDCIYTLLRSKEGYVAQTKIAYEASRYVLKELSKKYAVSGVLKKWWFLAFQVRGAFSEDFTDKILKT